MYGHGDFELAQLVMSHKVSLSKWQDKSDKEKNSHVHVLFENKTQERKDIKSTDGILIIPKTSTIAKKAGQHRIIKD